MSDVVKEVNQAASGGSGSSDPMAIDAREKAKLAAQNKEIENAANAARLAGSDSKVLGDMPMPSLANPADKFVPAMVPQVKDGSVGASSEVPQGYDSDVPKDGIDKGKSPEDEFVPKKTPQAKSGSVGPSSEVPQKTDSGKDGI
jgi:hypothetical protein